MPIILPTILGVAQAGVGVAQMIQGAKTAKNNVRPDYVIPEEYQQNLDLATNEASFGLSDAAKQILTQGADRGLGYNVGAALQFGMNPNQIGDFYSRYLDSLSGIALTDQQLRDQKRQELYGIRKDLAGQKITEFLYDKDAPFKDKAQLAATQQQQGLQNLFGGADVVGSSFIQNQYDDVYGQFLNDIFGHQSPTGGAGGGGY